MHGALLEGGDVAGVMADSLERAALARDNREPLMEGRLVLISPYDPAAGFNVGHAMQRNKVIYALADAGLVVTSDFEKGGIWTGAIEQLERFHFVPVFVRNGDKAGRGNAALIHHGERPWPNPESATELTQTFTAAIESAAAEPKQKSLSFEFKEQPAALTINEAIVEQAALDWLRELGCDVLPGLTIAPGEPDEKRYGRCVRTPKAFHEYAPGVLRVSG